MEILTPTDPRLIHEITFWNGNSLGFVTCDFLCIVCFVELLVFIFCQFIYILFDIFKF